MFLKVYRVNLSDQGTDSNSMLYSLNSEKTFNRWFTFAFEELPLVMRGIIGIEPEEKLEYFGDKRMEN